MFKTPKSNLVLLSMLVAGLSFTACGGGESEEAKEAPATEVAPATTTTDTVKPAASDSAVMDSASTRPVNKTGD